jgi:hypothetical protein
MGQFPIVARSGNRRSVFFSTKGGGRVISGRSR